MKTDRKGSVVVALIVLGVIAVILAIPIGVAWLLGGLDTLFCALIPLSLLSLVVTFQVFRAVRGNLPFFIPTLVILSITTVGLLIASVLSIHLMNTIDRCEGAINYVCVSKGYSPIEAKGLWVTLAKNNNGDDYLLILSYNRQSGRSWVALGFNSVVVTSNQIVKQPITCTGKGNFWGETITTSWGDRPFREDTWETLHCPIDLDLPDAGQIPIPLTVKVDFTHAALVGESSFQNKTEQVSFRLAIGNSGIR